MLRLNWIYDIISAQFPGRSDYDHAQITAAETVTKLVECCEHVGDCVETIVMKNTEW